VRTTVQATWEESIGVLQPFSTLVLPPRQLTMVIVCSGIVCLAHLEASQLYAEIGFTPQGPQR
jgi:hypothetical protein